MFIPFYSFESKSQSEPKAASNSEEYVKIQKKR